MSCDFIEFLLGDGKISQAGADKLKRWLQHAPHPIGMIALSHGLMTGNVIDEVLQRQSETQERFGEIAVKMALLTPLQVERLLEVQDFRRGTTAVEGVCLAGLMPLDMAARSFAEYLRRSSSTTCSASAMR